MKHASKKRAFRVVVEISGGNVQNVYADGSVDVELVDWDNIEAGDLGIDNLGFADGTSVKWLMTKKYQVL